MPKEKCSHKEIEWLEYKKNKKRGDGNFPPSKYCSECEIAKKIKGKPKENTDWIEEWNVILEREYNNLLTNGLTDEQAQRIINEQDDWFKTLIKIIKAEQKQEILDKLPNGLSFIGDLEGDAHTNGYNQCLAETKRIIKSL